MMKDSVESMEDAANIELKAKKLMTVARSKFYMLKVNYPDLAKTIDNEDIPTFNQLPTVQEVA
jgi:hypothetical protein